MHVPTIIDRLHHNFDDFSKGNGFHCIGNSNGGVSCFHAALQSPDLVHSVKRSFYCVCDTRCICLTTVAPLAVPRPSST